MSALLEHLNEKFSHHDYLGDGAYIAATNHGTFVIFTTDGITMNDSIELDERMVNVLNCFVKRSQTLRNAKSIKIKD